MGRIFFKNATENKVKVKIDRLFKRAYTELSKQEKKGLIYNFNIEELESGKLITWETTNYGK